MSTLSWCSPCAKTHDTIQCYTELNIATLRPDLRVSCISVSEHAVSMRGSLLGVRAPTWRMPLSGRRYARAFISGFRIGSTAAG